MRWIGIVMAALAGWTGGALVRSAGDAPPAVRQALLELAGPHELEALHAEVDNGQTVWEAEWLADGVEHEADVLADGTVLEHEFEVSADAVPAAVRAAAEALLGDDLEYEQVELTLYEVDDGERELLLLGTGEILADESDDDDDDDDD